MSTLHSELHFVDPRAVSFDENNPRGLTAAQIVNAPQFKKLTASVEKYGILEPLIIKKTDSGEAFVLIDGERRLRAALATNQSTIPALIAADDTDGRILAYQVHMLRDNWDMPAETKAIKKIIADLQEKRPEITEEEIKKELKEITAHTQTDISTILKLMKYDDDVITAVITKLLDRSYLVQIEDSFIRPLKKYYPDILDVLAEEKIRRIMVEKAMNKKLVGTRYLMDKFKDVFKDRDAKKRDPIKKILVSFLKSKNKSIKGAHTEYNEIDKPTKKKDGRLAVKPKNGSRTSSPDQTNTADIFTYKSIKVTKKQLTSIVDVRDKFERIGGSFSDEEREYVAEALYCLEKHCFKAATLMIWASGISRILSYISKNLTDFNKASADMSHTPKSVYKYYAKNFLKTAASIDEIRVNSNDRQVVSYLFYKKIVTETECKKLFADYSTRCDCAHPTDIVISPNQAISIFENVYDLILNNLR